MVAAGLFHDRKHEASEIFPSCGVYSLGLQIYQFEPMWGDPGKPQKQILFCSVPRHGAGFLAQLQVSCLSQQGCPIWVSLLMRACQDTAGDSGGTSCQPANTPAARASPLLSLLGKDSKCPTKLLPLRWSNHSAVLEVQVTNADMNWKEKCKEKKRLCNN